MNRALNCLRSVCLLGASVLSYGSATAMSFVVQPPYLYLGGPVVREDLATWDEAMRRYASQVSVVVLHQSGGGDSMAGRRIGEQIRSRGLDTVVLGRCSSACANMFLAGVNRQFGEPRLRAQTVLGYHGSYNRQTGAVNTTRSGDYFVQMTGGLMSESFVERFIRLENKRGLLRFVHKDQRLSEQQALAMICQGDEDQQRRDELCERLDDVDALNKGVVTTWSVRTVPTPQAPSTERSSQASWPRTPLVTPDATAAD